ncbi:hypothetical protein GCM10009733_022170 [Nonomuraea maheshkhaliensis]|uniref:Uncharacterized protein n=1 Tax=Nonomuraea maheshkhaliensis TaxID=419590 RepID=A0ABP4QVW8_9ACTN
MGARTRPARRGGPGEHGLDGDRHEGGGDEQGKDGAADREHARAPLPTPMERDKTSPGPLSSPHAAVYPIADPLARTFAGNISTSAGTFDVPITDTSIAGTDVPTSAPPSQEPMSQNAGSGSTNPEHAAISIGRRPNRSPATAAKTQATL